LKRLSNPWRLRQATSTAVGAAIVLPYLFATGLARWHRSSSAPSRICRGAARSCPGRSWWKSGMEMMVIGLGEAAITYGIGLLAPLLG
jgi:hypothetical protein